MLWTFTQGAASIAHIDHCGGTRRTTCDGTWRPPRRRDRHRRSGRQKLTPGQTRIIDELPALWADAVKRPVDEVEQDSHRAYFELLGQHSYPAADGRVLSCYSSSVAMEIVARSLATTTDAIGLVHPTFDNIPDILRGVGLRLVPVEKEQLHGGDLDPALLRSVGCLFVTTPNNPTGRVLSEERLRRLAAQCAEHAVVLTLDTSFRGFDTRAHYDHYAVLEASGCRWVVIEDTGKLWPTLELKIGWLVSAANVGLPLAKVYSDILLGVSPLVLSMVRRFAEDAAGGGLAELHRFGSARLRRRPRRTAIPRAHGGPGRRGRRAAVRAGKHAGHCRDLTRAAPDRDDARRARRGRARRAVRLRPRAPDPDRPRPAHPCGADGRGGPGPGGAGWRAHRGAEAGGEGRFRLPHTEFPQSDRAPFPGRAPAGTARRRRSPRCPARRGRRLRRAGPGRHR
jgi:enduracididine biosynthesis enzyme MppP